MPAEINKERSYHRFVAVVKSDTTIFEPSDALYVGGAGDLVVDCDGAAVTFVIALPGVTVLPIRTTMVYNATTATGIVRLNY